MPDNKNYVKDDYTIAFHASASTDYQLIVATYDQEVSENYSGTSWAGSQGANVGDFPRYTEFSSSFGYRWLQPFSGSSDWHILKNLEISKWEDANTVDLFVPGTNPGNNGGPRRASIGMKSKFTKDGKLYCGRATMISGQGGFSFPGGERDTIPMGVVEYISSSAPGKAGCWKINDFIVAGTASFSTVPADRQRLNFSASEGRPSCTGRSNKWDIVDVITPGRPDGGKEKCLVIQSNQRFFKDATDHTKGAYPPNIGDVYNLGGWQYLIYKSASVDGWYQETILDGRDLEAFIFAENGSAQKINDRHYVESEWQDTSSGFFWVASDPDSPSASGRSLGSLYHAHDLIAYTASFDDKLRLATLIAPNNGTYKNKYVIVHASSSVGGWAVEDFVYAGKGHTSGLSSNSSFVYSQKRNEFYCYSPLGAGSDSGRLRLHYISIIASASSGIYYAPGTSIPSGRGGFLNSTQGSMDGDSSVLSYPGGPSLNSSTDYQVNSDIENATETKSKKTDRLTLKELGLSNNLGAAWNNIEEWDTTEFFGKRMAFDDEGRLYVATKGRKSISGTADGNGDLKSGFNKIFILNNTTGSTHPDYNPHTSSAGWYIEETLIEYDYTPGGLLSDKDEHWYDRQHSGLSIHPTTRYYYHGGWGASMAVSKFQENQPFLFVGAPTTISSEHADTLASCGHGPFDHEPRGCGYLYASSSNGWSMIQKFENPTNFLSSSATSPYSYYHRSKRWQYESNLNFTATNYGSLSRRLRVGDCLHNGQTVYHQDYCDGFNSVVHALSGSVLAIGGPAGTRSPEERSQRWYPFESEKFLNNQGNATNLTSLVETGSGGGHVVIYDGNAQYTTETTTTRQVGLKDGAVPLRVGNIRGPFNIRGQTEKNTYRVSIGDKKK